MAVCPVLQAILKFNPLFPLVCPYTLTRSDPVSHPSRSSTPDLLTSCVDRQSQANTSSTAGPSVVSSEVCGMIPPPMAEEVTLSERSVKRRERKRKKMKALLEVVNLNDGDRCQADDCGEPLAKTPRLLTQCPVTEVEIGFAGTTATVPESPTLDYTQLKSTLKKKRPKNRRVELVLSSVGDHSALVMAAHSRTPIFLRDVQTLLLNAAAPLHAPWSPRWCNLVNAKYLTSIIVVVLDGVSLQDLQNNRQTLSNTHTLFPTQVEVISPLQYGTSVAEEIVNVPLSLMQRQRLVTKLGSVDAAVQSGLVDRRGETDPPTVDLPRHLPPCPVSRVRLMLDSTQLVDEGYPLLGAGSYSKPYRDFLPTAQIYKPVSDSSMMYSVDCEMCMTREGSELTSIAVVDQYENLVYSSLVKPRNAITDYLTRYSGITEEKLQGVTTRLEDVQQRLRQLLPPDAILIGQSLNYDLRALKMLHPYIIDTSCIFNISGTRGRKSKLSLLTYTFLGDVIQDDVAGHNPTEDALAALRLVKLKLERGYSYGDAAIGGYVPPPDRNDEHPPSDAVEVDENVEGLQTAAVNIKGLYTSLLSRVSEVDVNTDIVVNGPSSDIYRVAADGSGDRTTNDGGLQPPLQHRRQQHQPGSIRLDTVQSNKQVAECMCRAVSSPCCDLVLGHMELRDRLNLLPQNEQHRPLYKLDKRLKRLYRAAPQLSLILVVASGRRDEQERVQNGFCLATVKHQDVSSVCKDDDAGRTAEVS